MTNTTSTIHTLSITTILLFSTLLSYAQQPKQTLQWQGTNREYYTYVPTSYDSENGMPVMVFLHGFDGGIDSYNSSINFQQAADQFHWMIVLPQALTAHYQLGFVDIPTGSAWNSGIEMTIMGNPFVPNSDVDDSGFLLALVDSLGESYNLDTDSLFFTGFSMGAFMTHRMAIEHPDRINAVATASGLVPVCFADSTPSQHISVLHIHGNNDNVVHTDGTASPIPGMGEMTLGLSVENTIEYWRNANQCNLDAETITYADTENDGMMFSLNTYTSSTDDTRVAFLNVDGGEHKWYENGHDVQYLTVVHDFFTRSNSYIFTGIGETSIQATLTVYPSPANSAITIESANNTQLFIHSADGRVIATQSISEGANTIDISSYAAGIYLLRTTDGQVANVVVE